jgi:plastocyanin
MRRYVRGTGLGLSLALAAAGAVAGSATHRVRVEGMQFSPPTLTVAPGDQVVWENADLVPHTATAADGPAFDSGAIAPGAAWSLVPRASGRFAYVCTLHPTMKATLIVQPR